MILFKDNCTSFIFKSNLIASPNAEEAFALLGWSDPVTKGSVEVACRRLLNLGNIPSFLTKFSTRYVIIRCGSMGACMASSASLDCFWIEAFWQDNDQEMVVDVTGLSNSLSY